MLHADRDQIARFVGALFRYAAAGAIISLRAFDQHDHKRPPFLIHAVQIDGSLDLLIDQAAYDATRCATAARAVVFAPPICTFVSPDRARGTDLAAGIVLSVELDEGDTRDARTRLEGLLGPATVTVASGGEWAHPDTGETFPKLHLHWRLSEPTTTPDGHAKLRDARDMAARLVGADPTGKPVVHPLRWPGSWNCKSEPVLARIIGYNEAAEIHLAEAICALEAGIELAGQAQADIPRSGSPQADVRLIASAMAAIPNKDAHYGTWIRFGYALHRATGGADEGRDIWDAWSKKSKKFNGAEQDAAWRRIAHAINGSSAPRTIGAGTIFFLAAQQGWTRPRSPELPTITVRAGERHLAADAGLAALAAAEVPFYVRDRALVRVCGITAKASDGGVARVPAVTFVTTPMLSRALGQSARWETFSRKGEIIRIDPPRDVVEQTGAMIGSWPFPPLYGVSGTPTLRPDGSVLATAGYDPATGLVLFDPPPMPPIPDRPTMRDALDALALLDGLLIEFPFANVASRSVAISMLMTPVLRGALAPAVPMHCITAPEAGTGKSYLQDIACYIAVGDRCAVLSVANEAAETEKRLIGAALTQQSIIALDNVSELLMGDFLCQVTERPLLQVRPLGTSDLIRIANTFTVFANGNNLTIGADQVRRTVQCALDANMETPEGRAFRANPIAMIRADRGKYVAACLTIARAYIAAGRPGRLPPSASYEGWSDTVRSALVWLNWPDPVETVASVRVQDPRRQARVAVFTAWATELQQGIGYRTGELIALAEQYAGGKRARPALWDALYSIAAPRSGYQTIDPTALGVWLRDNKDTVAAGHKLTVDYSDTRRPRWRLS
jgi:putative DNA primase/helicase